MKHTLPPVTRDRRVAMALCCAVACACAHSPARPVAALEDARTRVGRGDVSPRQLALAGFQALYVRGAPDAAQALFARAGTADPWALTGLIALADRRLDATESTRLALSLCAAFPHHPLAYVAARSLLRVSGTAGSVDAMLIAGIPPLLAHGVHGETAQLLRAALWVATHFATDSTESAAFQAAAGVPTRASLTGPFFARRILPQAELTPPEKTGILSEIPLGPYGTLAPRRMEFSDGRFALSGEPEEGDGYLYATDFDVPSQAIFILTAASSMDYRIVVDGAPVLSRQSYAKPAPSVGNVGLSLSSGSHRIMVRLTRGNARGNFYLALGRADGTAAGLTFRAGIGPAPNWTGSGVKLVTDSVHSPTALGLYETLRGEGGDALARILAAQATSSRDHDGAARLVATGLEGTDATALALIRATVALDDESIPRRFVAGKVRADLEAAIARDPMNDSVRVLAAELELEDGRAPAALERLGKPSSARAHLIAARALLALGLDGQADEAAVRSTTNLPGFCDALTLRYRLARKRDSAETAKALLRESATCPDAASREADYAQATGHLAEAAERYRQQLAIDRSDAQIALSLSGVLASNRQFPEATKVLNDARALWPRYVQIVTALGTVAEQAHDAPAALAAREAALALNGANLNLVRQVARARTGREPLEEEAISTESVLANEMPPTGDSAASVYLLDFAAVRALPDGSLVERTHVIQRALNQEGVRAIAEVNLPDSAAVLKLRTLKADGRTLTPEHFEGKEAVSLPGVEVGDAVEYEFLDVRPSRGPGRPGFQAPEFYFAIPRQPNARSTYIVKAKRGAGLLADPHHLAVEQPKIEGDDEVFRHEERQVPAFFPEPNSPPQGTEWLPYVSVGAGERGPQGIFADLADAAPRATTITAPIETFAREAAGSRRGIDAIQAVARAVSKRIAGRNADLGRSAAQTLAQDRGSRTTLLVAALRSLGFDARLTIIRPLTSDPTPRAFPPESLYNYLCIRVVMPDSTAVWLDAMYRYAPFGELPDFAARGTEAWMLATPTQPLEAVPLPKPSERRTRVVELTMALTEAGELAGKGKETYLGFEAAQVIEELESVPASQRDQLFETALARYFGGAELSNLKVVTDTQAGPRIVVEYDVRARSFGQSDGLGRLTSGGVTFPLLLGRRYLATSVRNTDLLIDTSERGSSRVSLRMPTEWTLTNLVPERRLVGPNGQFIRTERPSGDTLTVEEQYDISAGRVAVSAYRDFADFAGAVDLAQQHDLHFAKR